MALQDLPTKVELLKSKNDADYIKGGEVGQVGPAVCSQALSHVQCT